MLYSSKAFWGNYIINKDRYQQQLHIKSIISMFCSDPFNYKKRGVGEEREKLKLNWQIWVDAG